MHSSQIGSQSVYFVNKRKENIYFADWKKECWLTLQIGERSTVNSADGKEEYVSILQMGRKSTCLFCTKNNFTNLYTYAP